MSFFTTTNALNLFLFIRRFTSERSERISEYNYHTKKTNRVKNVKNL